MKKFLFCLSLLLSVTFVGCEENDGEELEFPIYDVNFDELPLGDASAFQGYWSKDFERVDSRPLWFDEVYLIWEIRGNYVYPHTYAKATSDGDVFSHHPEEFEKVLFKIVDNRIYFKDYYNIFKISGDVLELVDVTNIGSIADEDDIIALTAFWNKLSDSEAEAILSLW